MIETYLSRRQTLKGVVAILDIRRMPGQEELNLIHWLDYFAISNILVLTKADKLSKTKQIKQQMDVAKSLGVDKTDLILFSAKSGRGRNALWDAILELTGIKPS